MGMQKEVEALQFLRNDFQGKEYNKKRDLQTIAEINRPATRNINLMKEIEGVDPKYAKHLLLKNTLIMQFAQKLGGGIDLLSQPVCNSCEGVAAWDHPTQDGKPRAYCFGCNKHTVNPYTVKQYLLDQLKGFDENNLEMLIKAGKENEDVLIW